MSSIVHWVFQSTRPSRGETNSPLTRATPSLFQSTRPSRGETHETKRTVGTIGNFNPLAPRGARRHDRPGAGGILQFQSTRPSRGETAHWRRERAHDVISIHSPLAGRDTSRRRIGGLTNDFNPLAPRGARRVQTDVQPIVNNFNPLAPRGARLRRNGWASTSRNFNPLAPRGARRKDYSPPPEWMEFQSTRPSRGETAAPVVHGRWIDISIHSPLAGRDPFPVSTLLAAYISIHSPLAGRDVRKMRRMGRAREFQSTRPSRGETPRWRCPLPRCRHFNPLAPRGARRPSPWWPPRY